MPLPWAITGPNLLRGTWTDSDIESSDTAAAGYPAVNVIDGNVESRWKADDNGAKEVIIDTGDDDLDMDYIVLWFDMADVPTAVNITTSDDGIAFGSFANQYDGSVNTTTSAALDGTTRVLPMNSTTNINIGNTIEIDDGVETVYYLVVNKGANYVEIDRYPVPLLTAADVTLVPQPVILIVVGGAESKRYIKIIVTGSPAHILEAQAFKVGYTFDNTDLPLSPFPVERVVNQGSVSFTMSNHGIGRMQTGSVRATWSLTLARCYPETIRVLEWLRRQGRFGILMDSGEWYEVLMVGNMNIARRPSVDAELITYTVQIPLQEI